MKKRIIFFITVLVLFFSCSKEEILFNQKAGITLYGYHTENNEFTKTLFGEVSSSKVPFKWSKGDYIWANGEKSLALEKSCDYAEFNFPPQGPDSKSNLTLFYNLTGKSNMANVLKEQTQEGVAGAELGKNGDFGYAVSDKAGKFSLKHYTSYLWFNVYGFNQKKLQSITIESNKDLIAGKVEFNVDSKAFLEIKDGSKEIKLSFTNGGILLPSAESSSINAAITILPNIKSGSTLKITYQFEDGIYFSEKKDITKDIIAGNTYKITTNISATALYTLAICDFDTGNTDWDSLIDSPQYFGPLLYPTDETNVYEWTDSNANIYSALPNNWGDGKYWGGGIAISNYYSTDVKNKGSYLDQLTVYGTTGYSGNNCAVSYGYLDIVSTQSWGDSRPYIKSLSGAKVFDCMWVNTTTYLLNCCLNGNSLTDPLTEEGYVKIIATGYVNEEAFKKGLNDNKNSNNNPEVEIFIAKKDGFITDWTKFDLSELGKVEYVRFNVSGDSDNGYGFSQPAYFAMDDIAVRVPFVNK